MKFDHKLTDSTQLLVRTNPARGLAANFNYDFPGTRTPGRNVVHRPIREARRR